MTKHINHYWRILGTGISFFIFGLGTLFIGLLFQIMAFMPFINPQKSLRKTIYIACNAYIRMMKQLGLLDYSIHVEQKKALNSTLIIANHPSLLDAIFLFATFDNLCCITKAKLWNNPFTGRVVRVAGFIANDSADFVEVAAKKIKAGENILIFPEGTRNSDNQNLRFKRGAANISVRSSCDILPLLIHCEPNTLQKGEKWYQVPANKPLFSISTLAKISLNDAIDTSRPVTLQYRDLTKHLSAIYQKALQAKQHH